VKVLQQQINLPTSHVKVFENPLHDTNQLLLLICANKIQAMPKEFILLLSYLNVEVEVGEIV